MRAMVTGSARNKCPVRSEKGPSDRGRDDVTLQLMVGIKTWLELKDPTAWYPNSLGSSARVIEIIDQNNWFGWE